MIPRPARENFPKMALPTDLEQAPLSNITYLPTVETRPPAPQRPTPAPDDADNTGGDDPDRAIDQAGDKPALTTAKILFAITLEHFRGAKTGGVLDGRIAVDERQAQPPGEAFADSRFSRAHQSDQDDRPVEALRQLFHEAGLYIGLSGRAKGPACHDQPCSSSSLSSWL